jgi:hypothetical protein
MNTDTNFVFGPICVYLCSSVVKSFLVSWRLENVSGYSRAFSRAGKNAAPHVAGIIRMKQIA